MENRSINGICVFGVGGVGGYFGGMLALKASQERKTGVSFIARGQHLEQIKRRGLMLQAGDQNLVCRPVLATSNMAEVEKDIDLLLICVKAYDLNKALEQAAPYIRSQTIVLPLLNGMDIAQRVRGVIKTGMVLPACVYIGANITEPGVVRQKGEARIIAGPDPAFLDFDPAPLQAVFDNAGLIFQWTDNPYSAIWEKYAFIASFALVTAHYRLSIGQVVQNSAAREQTIKIIEEISNLAAREGVPLAPAIASDIITRTKNFPYDLRTSFQRDLESGKPDNEIDIFGGSITRLGRKHGIPTPVTEQLYQALQKD